MKKVLLSLLAVAALVLSCQNYDDEFAALNSKVASLESQISSLAGLQTALTQVQSSVSALQAAVSAIPNLSSEVAAIIDDLDALATAVAGATTSADLDALKAELNTTLAALQALIEANSTDIASVVAANADLKSQLEALGVDVDSVLAANSTFEGNLTITNAAELAYAKSLGVKVKSIKGDVYVKVDETKLDGDGTGEGLTAAEVNEVLSQINFVVGNVKLVTDASLDLSALTSITGDYIVIGHDVSDDALTSVGDDVLFNHDGAYSSKIETADNIYLVMNAAAKAATDGSTSAKTGTTSIDFLAITKASSLQSIASATATSHTSGGSIASTSSDVTYTLAVAAETTSVKVGQAPVIAVTSSLTAKSTALTSIELHYAADTGKAADGLNPNGVAKLASLTVKGGEISSIVVKAKQITGAVTIDVTETTATSNTASVDLSSLLTSGAIDSDASSNDISSLETAGGIVLSQQVAFSAPKLTDSTGDITLAKATSFSAPLLENIGTPKTSTAAAVRKNITVDLVEGAITMSALELAGVVSFAEATSFTAKAADVTSVNIATGTTLVPTTVELLTVPDGGILDEATVGTVKLHGQKVTYTYQDMAAVTSLTVIGVKDATTKVAPNVTVGAANGGTAKNTKLASLTLGGDLGTVVIDMDAANSNDTTGHTGTALATVVTSGTIESITVDDNYDLGTLTLGHTDSTTASDASTIVVRRNHNLKSLKTSVASIKSLQVIDNGNLGTMDFASITKLPTNITYGTTVVDIDITGNYTDKATNTYTTRYTATATVAATASNPLGNWLGLTGSVEAATATVARSFTQGGLATLKPFFQVLEDTYNPATGTGKSALNVTVNLDYKYQALNNATPPALAVSTKSFAITGAAAGSNAGKFDEVLDLK